MTVLAHDLRNLLTPLKGRIALIERRARGAGRGADVEDARDLARSVARLHCLVADLLDVRRLDDGLFAIQPRPVDLGALVWETVQTLRTQHADVRADIPPGLVITADAERVRQAVENLLANALKHSPAGVPVEVWVEHEQRTDGAWAVVTVSDHGPGIPATLRPRLFTRFATGPGSVGLGIGLYLANEITAAHGGTLTLDSAPGEGARFRLALPVVPAQPLCG
jgi:signal transduction histidine kinase